MKQKKWELYDPWGDFCGFAYTLVDAQKWEDYGEGYFASLA